MCTQQKAWPPIHCKGIYNHGWPYFWLGGQLATTLMVKWPGASFGGQAPCWHSRFVERPKKNKGGQFTVDIGTSRSHEYTGSTQKMHQNRAFSMLDPVYSPDPSVQWTLVLSLMSTQDQHRYNRIVHSSVQCVWGLVVPIFFSHSLCVENFSTLTMMKKAFDHPQQRFILNRGRRG